MFRSGPFLPRLRLAGSHGFEGDRGGGYLGFAGG